MESMGTNSQKCAPGGMSPYSPGVSQASPLNNQGGCMSPSSSGARMSSPAPHHMATPPPAHISSYPVLGKSKSYNC